MTKQVYFGRTLPFLLFLFGLITVFLALGSGLGATEDIHVDDNAAPGGDGSAGSPFQTIQEAIDAAAINDSILVEEGNYLENIVVDRTLDIQGAGSDSCFIDGAPGSEQILLVESQGVSVSGFHFGSADSGEFRGIRVVRDWAHIFGNRFSNTNYGVELESYSWSVVEDNHFNNKFNNIYLNIADNNTIQNNVCEFASTGIKLRDSDGNLFYDNTVTGSKNGITLENSSNSFFDGNSITDNKIGLSVTADLSQGYSRNNRGHNNLFAQNRDFALLVEDNGGYSFRAVNNSWGSLFGPYHPATNPEGRGGAVSDDVIFTPWVWTLDARQELGEVLSGEGMVHRDWEVPADRELDEGDVLVAGDEFSATMDSVILIRREVIGWEDGTGDLFLFVEGGATAALLLDHQGLFLGVRGGFASLYVEVEGGEPQAQTRADGDELRVDLLFGLDPDLISISRGEYDVLVDLEDVSNTTFFSLDVGEETADVVSYSGSVDVRSYPEEDIRTVEELEQRSFAPEGDQLDSGSASYELIQLEGDNVEPTVLVDEKELSETSNAYLLPGFGGEDRSLILIHQGDEYEVDVEGRGSGDYSFSFSHVRNLGEKNFEVDTTSTTRTQDSYGVDQLLALSIRSAETSKTYDLAIVSKAAGATSNFVVSGLAMTEGDQVFSVNDWDDLEETPVSYFINGQTLELESGMSGAAVSQLLETRDTDPTAIIISITIVTYFLAVIMFGGHGGKSTVVVKEKLVFVGGGGASRDAAGFQFPDMDDEDDDGLMEIVIDEETGEEVDPLKIMLREGFKAKKEGEWE